MPGTCPAACLFSQADLATATDYAVANGARVLNFSLGDAPSLASGLRQSLAAAAAADTVLVFAAGNLGLNSPRDPGRFAQRADALGRAIIVGSVDADNVISSFSNRAGSAADVFIVAPGENLQTTGAGGGSVLATGTSVATPLVSGAAAAVLDAAPYLAADEVVDILLGTARDLGAPGTDAIYGRGLLDLDRALAPVGALAVPVAAGGDGAAAPVATSGLGAGCGLRRAATRGRAGPGARRLWAGLHGRDGWRQRAARPAQGAERSRASSIASGVARRGRPGRAAFPVDFVRLAPAARAAPVIAGSDLGSVAARLELGDGLRVRGFAGPAAAFDDTEREVLPAGGFAGLANEAGLAMDSSFGGAWTASIDLHAGKVESGELGAGARLAELGLERRLGEAFSLRLGFGVLDEADGPLGSSGSGRAGPGGLPDPLRQSHRPAGADRAPRSLRPGGTRGDGRGERQRRADPDRHHAQQRASPWAWTAADLLQAEDRLGFSILQPLRVDSARPSSTCRLPQDATGAVFFQRQEADLAPDGREIDVELTYGWGVGRARLQAAAMLRLEPDHDASAGPSCSWASPGICPSEQASGLPRGLLARWRAVGGVPVEGEAAIGASPVQRLDDHQRR
ncbi:MAG: S8 family serine peptidase [Geminicoccaceae bacterium]